MLPARPPGRPLYLAVAALALFAIGNAGWSAWRESWTIDEPFHLGWARRVLETGSTRRDDLPSYNSKTPVSMLNALSQISAESFTESDRALRFAARLPTVLLLAGLLAATFAAASGLGGPWAGLIAAAGVALDPSLVGHASLVTVDTPYALATLLTLWAVVALADRPRPAAGVWLGLALGFAFVTKYTAVLLLGALILLPLAAPRPAPPGYPRRLLSATFLALVVAYVTICAGYLFIDIGAPLGGLGFKSTPFLRLAQLAPGLPSPFPADFLTGLDQTIWDDGDFDWPVYMLGRGWPGGSWLYFPFHWLVKTPLLLLLAQATGLARVVRSRAALVEPRLRYLLVNLALTLVYFAFMFRTQIGYRFVLMCIPLAWVVAARGLSTLISLRAGAGALVLAVAVGVAENLIYFGDPLAFTNAAVLHKREAFRLVGYSNIDWKQNRDGIQALLRARRIKTRLDPIHILPGHVTMTAFDLTRLRRETAWVRDNLDPVEHYLHTYLAFQVTREQFDRFMDANRRFPTTLTDAARCRDAEAERKPIGTGLDFEVEERPARATAWLACVEAKERADVIFKSRKGTIEVGHYSPDGTCVRDEVEDGQEAWFRLEPGLHALCVVEPRMHRAWLPYQIDGRWLAEGRARLSLQETDRPVE